MKTLILLFSIQISFAAPIMIQGEIEQKLELSGFDCIEQACILANDETNSVQTALFDKKNNKINILAPIILDKKAKELDLEGVAAGNDAFYAVGSHGMSRKSRKYNKDAHSIFSFNSRIPYNIKKSSLKSIFMTDEYLSKYYGTKLQKNGLNIEGLTFKDDKLFIGLRAPSYDGSSFIIEVSPEKLFTKNYTIPYLVHKIFYKKGYGIRGMATTSDGILLLMGDAGPKDSNVFSPKGEFKIAIWSDDKVYQLYNLPKKDNKPESIFLINENQDTYTVGVFRDGVENGSPQNYTFLKRPVKKVYEKAMKRDSL